jgi:hypothetical protein
MSSSHDPPTGTPEETAAPGASPEVPIERLVSLLPLFRQQLRAAETRAALAQSQADHLRNIVDGLEGLSGGRRDQMHLFVPLGSATPTEVEQGPRGQEAVRLVMASAPDRVWSLGAITHEILDRGWIDPGAKVPAAAIRAATQRLAGAGFAEKVAPGRYRLTERGKVGNG